MANRVPDGCPFCWRKLTAGIWAPKKIDFGAGPGGGGARVLNESNQPEEERNKLSQCTPRERDGDREIWFAILAPDNSDCGRPGSLLSSRPSCGRQSGWLISDPAPGARSPSPEMSCTIVLVSACLLFACIVWLASCMHGGCNQAQARLCKLRKL